MNLNKHFLFLAINFLTFNDRLIAAAIQENTWKVSVYKRQEHSLIKKDDKFEVVLDRKNGLDIPSNGTKLKCILSPGNDISFLNCGEFQMGIDCKDKNGSESHVSFELNLTKDIAYYIDIQCILGKAQAIKGK